MQQLALLKAKRFLPLFVTQFLGAFNDNVFKNALVILITFRIADLIHANAQLLVVIATGLFILPFFLFSATAGQLADKYEKSTLIRIVKFYEIIIMIFAVIGFYLESAYFLMFVLFALGVQATFFGPLKYSILPEQLKAEELLAGNGLIEAGTFIAILLGTILGGILILQNHGENYISAIIFCIAVAGWGISFFIPKTHQQRPDLKINYNFISETHKLLLYAKDKREIALSILGISWFWLLGTVFLSILPGFAKDILNADQSVITFFLTLFSIGLAIGSALCNRLLKGKIQATYVPLAVIGITIFTIDLYYCGNQFNSLPPTSNVLMNMQLFLQSTHGIRIAVDLFLIAFAGGIYTVPLYAMLQHLSSPSHRARVIASNNVMNALFMVIASVITAIMIHYRFTVMDIFLTLAIANTFVAIYICKLLPDQLIRSLFRVLLRLFYRVKVIGLENYYQAGERVVIVSNHTSFIDAILLASFLPDKLTFAINSETAKEWWIKAFIRMVDAYPLDPTNPMAIKSLIRLVSENKRCVIFPEGRITVTGALMKVYEGPSMIADKARAKLLPIHISGAQFTPFSRLKNKVRIDLFPNIFITIHPPTTLSIDDDSKGRAKREKMGRELYDLMTNMAFQSQNFNQTLFRSLISATRLHGKKHIIMSDVTRENISYKQLLLRSFILGNLTTPIAKPGEPVGILLPNMASNVITYFGLLAYGRIPSMLNYTTGSKNVVAACHLAKIQSVITSEKFIEVANLTTMINALKESGVKIYYLENLKKSLNLMHKMKGKMASIMPRTYYKFIHIMQSSKHLLNKDQAATILFTSGSEGTPKGVVLTHYNLQSNRYQLAACIDFTPADTIFNALPIFHAFGLTAGTLLPLLSGVKIFLYPTPLHYRIIPQVVYDINATIMFGTDTFLAGYAKHAHPYDFYSIRYIFAGAEKLRDETQERWSKKFGIRIFEGYGATEAAPVVSINTPIYNKIGTVGRLLPGITHKLQAIPGIEEGGSLILKGPNIMKGYYLYDHPGKLVMPPDGWYDTGDIVSMDTMGFITIKGRLKRFAKIAGEMVSLPLIEDLIYHLDPNHQHAIVSIPNDRKGEEIVLVTTAKSLTREAIHAHLQKHQISEISTPKKIFYIETMFLLGSGKTDYPSVLKFVLEK